MAKTDEDLLGYCEIHCKTERALFHHTDIERVYALAGCPRTFHPEYEDFVTVFEDEMMPLIKLARERMANPPPLKPDGWGGFPLGEPE